MRKLVRKSYTPVVPIANTCSIGYPHDGRADNDRHDSKNASNVTDELTLLESQPDLGQVTVLQLLC